MQASGVRLGTAAITTRGLGVEDMRLLGGWIADVLEAPGRRGRAPGASAARWPRPPRAHPIYA